MKHHFSLRKLPIIAGIACALFVGLSAAAPVASAHDQMRAYYVNNRLVKNHHDNRLKVNGHIQINRPGQVTATLIDTARAYSSCNGCSSFAVALQINLISPKAVNDNLEVTAIAKNYECTGCTTEAIAIQMDVITDNYFHVPDSVRSVVQRLNRELDDMEDHPQISAGEAEQRIHNVVSQFLAIRFPDPPARAASPRANALPKLLVQWFRTTGSN